MERIEKIIAQLEEDITWNNSRKDELERFNSTANIDAVKEHKKIVVRITNEIKCLKRAIKLMNKYKSLMYCR